MSCRRCQGLVIKTYGLDVEGTCEPVMIELWRCISCGDITDEQILMNRQKREIELLESVWHPDNVKRIPVAVNVLIRP